MFKKWTLVTLIGDICTILGSIFFYWTNHFPVLLGEFFVGFGAFFLWISITRYV